MLTYIPASSRTAAFRLRKYSRSVDAAFASVKREFPNRDMRCHRGHVPDNTHPAMNPRMRHVDRTLSLLAGMAALLMAALITVPTSAAYGASPAAAGMESDVPTDWEMPQARIEGRRIVDAAYHPTSGHTFMLADGSTTSQIFVSAAPGETPTAQALPTISDNFVAHRLIVDGDVLVTVTKAPAGTVVLTLFNIGTGGELRYRQGFVVGQGGAEVLAIDARNKRIVIALGERALDTAKVQVFDFAGSQLDAYRCALRFDQVEDVSVAPVGGQVWIGLSVAQPSCPDSGTFTTAVGEKIEAESVSRAWVSRSGGLTLIDGESHTQWSGAYGDVHHPSMNRGTRVVLAFTVDGRSFQQVSADATGTECTVGFGMERRSTALLSGHGAVLVLVSDGSIGWLM